MNIVSIDILLSNNSMQIPCFINNIHITEDLGNHYTIICAGSSPSNRLVEIASPHRQSSLKHG